MAPRNSISGLNASGYRATGSTVGGGRVYIRAIRPEDHDRLLAHFNGLSAESKVFRFHGAKRSLSEVELNSFTQLDFVSHVGLVTTFGEALEEPLIGVGRYIVLSDLPDRAEVGFAVLDRYQGKGIGSLLLRHLALIGRTLGIKEFQAEVLDSNYRMLEVFADSGLPVVERNSRLGVTHAVFSVERMGPARWESRSRDESKT